MPLLRAEPITALRLHGRVSGFGSDAVVSLPGGSSYTAFVPHAFVATWSTDERPAAAFGTQLDEPGDSRYELCELRFLRRMSRWENKTRLRFLPMHLAVEGYLALHFGGPAIAWQEWTHDAVNRGLSSREEEVYAGGTIAGLDEALRIFEIHPGQCGMVLYVADAVAAAFVVPHPDDYRALHPTLLQDMYGELIHQYALMYPSVADFRVRIDDSRVDSVAGLRAELAGANDEWVAYHQLMADGLLGVRSFTSTRVRRLGRFTLSRFLPDFTLTAENHIGATITDQNGTLAYFKTFRLSAAQTRRGYLLHVLAGQDWRLDDAAAAIGTDRDGLVRRLDRAGFGHLLRADIIDANRARAR